MVVCVFVCVRRLSILPVPDGSTCMIAVNSLLLVIATSCVLTEIINLMQSFREISLGLQLDDERAPLIICPSEKMILAAS